MDNQLFEYIGYFASVMVAISLMMTSFTRLRIINTIGAVLFAVYGFLIHSYPVAILNCFMVVLNLFQLYRLHYKTEKFSIIQTPVGGEYIANFVKVYQKQIKRFKPDFNFDLSNYDVALLTLRDMNIAGVIIGKETDEKTLNIGLDFVIPEYRDMKIGTYVFIYNKQYFKNKGYNHLITTGENKQHENYLKKVGFLNVGTNLYEIKM